MMITACAVLAQWLARDDKQLALTSMEVLIMKTPRTPKHPPPDVDHSLDGRVEYVPIPILLGMQFQGNPKKHDIPGITAAIARFGFTMWIVVDARTNVIAAGHGRLEAAAALKATGATLPVGAKMNAEGEWCLPVIRHAFVSDIDRDAYVIADNKLQENGGSDRDATRALLLRLGDRQLLSIGYGEDEYRKIVSPPQAKVEEVDVSSLEATFTLVVRGKIAAQPEVIRTLREKLAAIPGVTVEGRIEDAGRW